MIVFRDATARRLGLDLLVQANEEGRALGISPITSGSALHTEVMKTEALKQTLDRYAFDAAFGGRGATRRGAAPGSISQSQRRAWLEPEEPASGTMAAL